MTLKEAGIRLTLQGEAAYVSGLKRISTEMKSMSTASKLAVAQLGNNAKQSDIFKVSAKNLSNELKTSETKTTALRNAQEKYSQSLTPLKKAISETTDKHSEAAKKTEELKLKYEEIASSEGKRSKAAKEAKKEYEASKTATNQLANEVKDLTATYDDNVKKLEKLPNEINKSELASQNLRNEIDRLDESFKKLGGNNMDIAKRFIDFGQAMKDAGAKNIQMGANLTQSITRPIVSGFKQAIIAAGEFNSEIGALGPLLSGGKKITAEVRGEMDLLGNSSRKWAVDYGKSTTEINQGMAELIRNGYTSSQVMGMIPSILDASIASGEGFNTVMNTSSQVLSQFNLKGNNTNETLTNTQRVADSLTFVANATASGFSDLGAGMAYVGPVANSLNMSVEETASILGILSNKGIEASAGGTALRGALTRLLKPSKQNADAMQKLGFSAEEFKNGSIKLPEIIDRIKDTTKDWTDEQRAAAIATAFGTEAQTAMNALVEEGGGALRTLTTEAKNASGATKEIADSMKELPEFKYQQLVAQVKDLGIELGNELLPIAMDVMGVIKDLAEWFGNLDDDTKKLVITIGLLSAAIGPLLTVFGTLQTTIGSASTVIGKMFQLMGSHGSLFDTADALDDVATATGGVHGIAGKLLPLLGKFALPIGLTTAALTLGYVAWKTWGEEAWNSYQRVKEFPDISNLTSEQAESLRSVKDEVSGLVAEMSALNSTSDLQSVSENVGTLADEILRLNTQKIEDLEAVFARMPESVKENLSTSLEELIANIEAQSQEVITAMERIDEISRKGVDENGRLRKEYFNEMRGLTDQMLQYYSYALSEDADQQRQIYQTLTKDRTQMTVDELETRVKYWEDSRQKAIELSKQEQDDYYQLRKQGAIKEEEYQSLIEQSNRAHKARLRSIDREYIQDAIAMFEARELETFGTLDRNSERYKNALQTFLKELGYSVEEAQALINEINYDDPVRNIAQWSDSMDEALKNASTNWNTAINKFAEGLGKFASELSDTEIKDFISQINDLGVSWAELELLTKEGRIEGNAKQFIEEYVELQGGWDALILQEKQAQISLDDKSLIKAIGSIEDYNNLTIKEKIATLTTMGNDEIQALLEQLGIWDSLDPNQQDVITNAQGTELVEETIHAIENWNTLTPEDKAIHIESQVANQNLKDVISESDLWNNKEFQDKFIQIDTSAPDAELQIVNLVNEFRAAEGLPPLEVTSKAVNFDGTAESVKGLLLLASAGASDMPLLVTKAETQGVDDSKSKVQELGATADANSSKSVSVTSNLIGMVANLVTIGLYNLAVGAMSDKSVTATTGTPSMSTNTSNIVDYNKKSGEMKNTQATATTNAPGITNNTSNVKDWNTHQGKLTNKTSTATTSTPNIVSNTSSVKSWNAAVSAAYSKSVTFTTYHDKVYRTVGKHATGGHIGMFANGGNLKWGGMFANGGGVPVGYTGIVGEAGPEIFQVTKRGVNITPLSTREKMRGIEGVLEDYNGGNSKDTGVTININIDGPVLREEQDIDNLATKISQRLNREVKMSNIFNRGRLAT